jgi:4-amino-4-deoxy-L-arabinose transferase-like glycosyltransferase
VPVVDDWAYAWSVERLLQTGHLLVLVRSSCYPIVQILWGALFARVAGFSFAALRLSTVVLAIFCCCAIYLTLREFGVSVRVSLLAAWTVALNPIFFVLAFTYMTDVPFLSLSSIGLFFYVSGFRRDRPARLWWGTLFLVLAFLIRQIGVLLPLAAFAAVDRRSLSWSAVRRYWLPPAVGCAAVAVLWFALPIAFGRLAVIDDRVDNLRWILSMGVLGYTSWNIDILWTIAFPLAPLLLCQFTRPRRAIVILGVSTAVIVVMKLLAIEIPTPLHDGQTWSLQSLLLSTNLIGGQLPPSASWVHVAPVLKVAGTVLVVSLLASVGSLVRSAVNWRPTRVLLAAGLLHLAIINVAWLYYDRYYLVFTPTLALLAVAPFAALPARSANPTSPTGRMRTWPALVLLCVWAFISVTGTRYVLANNAAQVAMARDLEAKGVAPADINAGYPWTAWHLYAHPENLAPGMTIADVPWVTSDDRQMPYRVVTVPGPSDEILRTEYLPAAGWQATDRIYLVHSRP